jgi:hypothetical protein
MKRTTIFVLALCSLLATSGSEPLASDEAAASIKLPTRTVTTVSESVPTEVTTEELVTEIEIGVWYAIRSTVPLIVLDSPKGSVTIITGATVVDGVFAGGSGKSETRVFDDSQHTYLIQGLKPCTTELILIPEGVLDRQAIVRHVLTVSGDAPNPPPGPGPDPGPNPGPEPPPEPVESFRVIFVKESGQTLPVAQSGIPAAKEIRDFLRDNTTVDDGIPGWREYDPDRTTENEEPTMAALWEAVKPRLLPAPCMVIEVNGHATVMPFPSNVAECMETLKEYRGE